MAGGGEQVAGGGERGTFWYARPPVIHSRKCRALFRICLQILVYRSSNIMTQYTLCLDIIVTTAILK